MKYIRTKDGIYETITQNLYKNDDLLYIDGYNLERVIKQADTIEELCDEFVPIKNGDFKGERFYFIKDLINFLKANNMLQDYTIYGAIWTDKGLQFVARMNNKGVLELI